jgi:timeless
MLERILITLRNILHIPADPSEENRTDDDASVHDQVLYAIRRSDLDAVLLYLASSDSERQLALHVLEIISLMMREQNPGALATLKPSDDSSRLESDKNEDEVQLLLAREKEMAKKRATEYKYGSR